MPVNVNKVKILVVKSHEKMGKLISDIVNGNVTRPGNTDELETLLLSSAYNPNPNPKPGDPPPFAWPNGKPTNKKINYVVVDDDQLTILLPSANALKAGMDIAHQQSRDGEYPLPKEYDLDYVDPTRKKEHDKTNKPITPQDWEIIYAARIGDYTCNKCM